LTASFYIYKSTVAALVFFLKFTLSGFSRSGGGAKWPHVGESSRRVNLNFSTKRDKSVDPLTNGRSPSLISLMIRKLSPAFFTSQHCLQQSQTARQPPTLRTVRRRRSIDKFY
ncbi:conserved hypothetical protein, partial [Trichinella spiralis]|uniref:hypothetical protein n=1 Tax=Trichinella spiralis TaxID=6334 RepID=UPI0001EFDCCC